MEYMTLTGHDPAEYTYADQVQEAAEGEQERIKTVLTEARRLAVEHIATKLGYILTDHTQACLDEILLDEEKIYLEMNRLDKIIDEPGEYELSDI